MSRFGIGVVTAALWACAPFAGYAQNQEVAPPGAGAADIDRPAFGFDARLGFLITQTPGHADRPVMGADVRWHIVHARVGSGPGLALVAGGTIEFAEFFAEVQSESYRIYGGAEVPFPLAETGSGRVVELVPLVQAGHLSSRGGDERSGFTARVALGVRVPVGSGPMHITFEPFGLTWLPDPPDAPDGYSSALAFEMGLIRIGWSF